jgi:23S rRNA pseudouridine955/2504/2580 synthase
LVIAKKASVLKDLNQQFSQTKQTKSLEKEYLTLLEGFWRGGTRRVEKALDVNHRRAGERHVQVSKNGSDALSIFTPLDVNKSASLLKVILVTGRTHQVRVHALAEGHPVLGDSKYGTQTTQVLSKELGLHRLFLHAYTLSFRHPVSKTKVNVCAPIPDELLAVLNKLNLEVQA